MIYTSFDWKLYFRFSHGKIFEVRPRKITKLRISRNAWAEMKFGLEIRNQRKISRRMVYNDGTFLVLSHTFPIKYVFHAYAIVDFL